MNFVSLSLRGNSDYPDPVHSWSDRCAVWIPVQSHVYCEYCGTTHTAYMVRSMV